MDTVDEIGPVLAAQPDKLDSRLLLLNNVLADPKYAEIYFILEFAQNNSADEVFWEEKSNSCLNRV